MSLQHLLKLANLILNYSIFPWFAVNERVSIQPTSLVCIKLYLPYQYLPNVVIITILMKSEFCELFAVGLKHFSQKTPWELLRFTRLPCLSSDMQDHSPSEMLFTKCGLSGRQFRSLPQSINECRYLLIQQYGMRYCWLCRLVQCWGLSDADVVANKVVTR